MSELSERYLAAKRALFDKVFGEKLNPEQRRAVFTVKGPLLVLAGAGSGKTTVLVNRISYIVKYGNAYFSKEVPEGTTEEDVRALEALCDEPCERISEVLPDFITEPCPPWALLAFTFTNKAANEIKSRLSATIGDPAAAAEVWAGTFHSVCVRILRKFGGEVGVASGFSIYDTDDSKKVVSACMRELGIDEKSMPVKSVMAEISRAKDALTPPESFSLPDDPREEYIRKIYERYDDRLADNNAVDFDGIIMKTVLLLQNNKEVREYYQKKFRYVLVDEYQDTNYAQFVLTKLLGDGYRNIMVVGDDDQSIYRFRGATVENILNFDKNYPDAEVVKLESNYRSAATILMAANSIIANNRDRHEKTMRPTRPAGEKITVKISDTDADEARYIASRINRGVSAGAKYSDFAVLYRLNQLSRSIEEAFVRSGIPYRVFGGMKFYDRKEVKDMLAYLFMLGNSVDNLRLRRVINQPKRRIGAAAVEAVAAIADREGKSMYDVLLHVRDYPLLEKSRDKFEAFTSLIEGVRRDAPTPAKAIEELYVRSGYRDMLSAMGVEGECGADYIEELRGAAVQYEQRCAEDGTEPTLRGFLEEVMLVSDIDKYDDDSDSVVLMTVHSAKGLEFPTVFLAGMEDGIFPSEANKRDPTEMAEERRLCYVAITRAKNKLYITATRTRFIYGQTNSSVRLSSFISDECDRSLLDFEEDERIPPRRYSQPGNAQPRARTPEMDRVPDIFGDYYGSAKGGSDAPHKATSQRRGASDFGIDKLRPGTRVSHITFGSGTIVSARDLGGDVLYEVDFDTAGKKKLMATYARLEKI